MRWYDGEALPRAIELGRRISLGPREAVAAIERGVRGSLRQGRQDSVRMTLELSDHLFKTKDCEEGITAFSRSGSRTFRGPRERSQIGGLSAVCLREGSGDAC
jgi:enoyl-CoA hydratase/carnithine racemase